VYSPLARGEGEVGGFRRRQRLVRLLLLIKARPRQRRGQDPWPAIQRGPHVSGLWVLRISTWRGNAYTADDLVPGFKNAEIRRDRRY
jgi:hypothetical protein